MWCAVYSLQKEEKSILTFPTVTDIAGEMDALTDTFTHCKNCQKACIAAVEMLAVRGFFPDFRPCPV